MISFTKECQYDKNLTGNANNIKTLKKGNSKNKRKREGCLEREQRGGGVNKSEMNLIKGYYKLLLVFGLQ